MANDKVKKLIEMIRALSPDHYHLNITRKTELKSVLHEDDWKTLATAINKHVETIKQYITVEALAKII